MGYDVASLGADINSLVQNGATSAVIGYTQLGREIPVVMKGSVENAQVLVVGCTHAREFVTTPLVIEMLRNYTGKNGVWCVPMLNIDGAMLCQYGTSSVSDPDVANFLVQVNSGNTNFDLWKGNARAVDLNVNFNAKWGTGTQNVTYPSPANYIGEFPVSESENIALRQLILELQPSVVLTYHTKGNVIFWGFECIQTYRKEAELISNSTGYPILESENSAGGLKDWYDATTFKLGLTIEVAEVELEYPLSLDIVPSLYERNKDVLNIAVDIAQRIG